jgi:hypothetical protein
LIEDRIRAHFFIAAKARFGVLFYGPQYYCVVVAVVVAILSDDGEFASGVVLDIVVSVPVGSSVVAVAVSVIEASVEVVAALSCIIAVGSVVDTVVVASVVVAVGSVLVGGE